jgi:pyrroloquinoline quinone biosynthesis protein D
MARESIPPTARPKISGRARLQTDRISGKPVLLYPEGALLLNPTAHAIVSLCTGKETLGTIVASLAARYHSPAQEISSQVTGFLDRLRAKNLLDLI